MSAYDPEVGQVHPVVEVQQIAFSRPVLDSVTDTIQFVAMVLLEKLVILAAPAQQFRLRLLVSLVFLRHGDVGRGHPVFVCEAGRSFVNVDGDKPDQPSRTDDSTCRHEDRGGAAKIVEVAFRGRETLRRARHSARVRFFRRPEQARASGRAADPGHLRTDHVHRERISTFNPEGSNQVTPSATKSNFSRYSPVDAGA
jgi:hypothetical protein